MDALTPQLCERRPIGRERSCRADANIPSCANRSQDVRHHTRDPPRAWGAVCSRGFIDAIIRAGTRADLALRLGHAGFDDVRTTPQRGCH